MSKPLAQMPYQTVGDLALTFPQVDAVENYRRDLDLATATAHVSYTSGGVTFSREVFASAPDQVIVVRLTASRPGQISFEARMQTPQRATVEATADGDLVMRGVNGDGAGHHRRRPSDDRRAALRSARPRAHEREARAAPAAMPSSSATPTPSRC